MTQMDQNVTRQNLVPGKGAKNRVKSRIFRTDQNPPGDLQNRWTASLMSSARCSCSRIHPYTFSDTTPAAGPAKVMEAEGFTSDCAANATFVVYRCSLRQRWKWLLALKGAGSPALEFHSCYFSHLTSFDGLPRNFLGAFRFFE